MSQASLITSADNPKYKLWLELASSKGIKKHDAFILMGEKLIYEFLQNPNFEILAEITTEKMKPLTDADQFKVSSILFKNIDVIGTHFNLLVLQTKSIPEYSPEPSNNNQIDKNKATGSITLFCPLGDPANLGAITRSALAFGVEKIVLTQEACNPYLPRCIKSSAGAVLKTHYESTGSISDIVEKETDVIALDMRGENIFDFKFPSHVKLLVGEEGPGIGFGKNLTRVSIPTHNVESLNAAVAASIAIALAKKSH